MLRILAWIELSVSILLLAMVFWPISTFCNGRTLGLDCESWFIFGVNLFGPAGLLALVCSVLSLWLKSWIPQKVLLFGWAMILACWWVSLWGFT